MDILLIDSYDSFTFNLADLIRKSIPSARVHVVHNDDFNSADLVEILPHFHAVVIGPGPGSPDDPSAVGAIPAIWNLPDDHILPILGVCLGHQSLCLAFGGSLRRLPEVKHGLKSRLTHVHQDLLHGVESADVVRYHSLHVEVSAENNDLVPLAWTTDKHGDGSQSTVIMAARHRTKPFWGVQYHPESICTSGGGEDVVKNFWRLASAWNESHRRNQPSNLPADWRKNAAPRSKDLHPLPLVPCLVSGDVTYSVDTVRYAQSTLRGSISIPRICEVLRARNGMAVDGDFVVLDSAAAPGRFSIIGIVTPGTQRIYHTVGDSFVTVKHGNEDKAVEFQAGEDMWKWLARLMDERKAAFGHPSSPFWGGLIGIANYEAGVASLDVPIAAREGKVGPLRPDSSFAFIERSVVIDHKDGVAFVQSIVRDETDGELNWIKETAVLLESITDPAFTPAPTPPIYPDGDTSKSGEERPSLKIEMPDEVKYLAKIRQAQAHLDAGDSYEICLTALTRITVPKPSQSLTPTGDAREYLAWRLFKALRVLNPAAHGSYIRLGGTTLVGSSPERFLSWTRDGLCQLRPIKGTIKKVRGDLPDVTFAEAEDVLLGSAKEIAENLMIVDLIRHDLHRVVSAGSSQTQADDFVGRVSVEKLFSVEETETVFHLVSVIEGRVDTAHGYTGWDVLSRSLPPGSMTGAPKKRSVELLQGLEASHTDIINFQPAERGVYSGVSGYWCVGGGGDFNVIIRSAFRYDDESTTFDETWYLGAGGAITALSNPHEEWDEMRTKLSSTLRAFAHI